MTNEGLSTLDLRQIPDPGLPCDPTRRMVATYTIEVVMCAPHIEPFTDGRPRIDSTGRAYMTSACLRRPARDYLADVCGEAIYRKRGADLMDARDDYKKRYKDDAREAMLADLIDLRLFGGVLPLVKRGGVHGPFTHTRARTVQAPVERQEMGFAVSGKLVDEVVKSGEYKGEVESKLKGNGTPSYIIEHAVFVGHLYFNPIRARTVSEADLRAFWCSMVEGWDHARSTVRSGIRLRTIHVRDYPVSFGAPPQDVLAGWTQVKALTQPATCWEDYTVADRGTVKPDMTLTQWVDGDVEVLARG